MQPRRFVTLDAKNEPRWVRLHVQSIGDQWVAAVVPDGVEPPKPGKVKGMGFFGGTHAEATELALRYVGRCTEQN